MTTRVLNLTAEIEASPFFDDEPGPDVVFRLDGHEVWTTKAQPQRYDEARVIDTAVEEFADRLKKLLAALWLSG